MKKENKKWIWIGVILVIFSFCIVWFYDLINNSVNSLTLDKSCSIDSDCIVKNTNCYDDDPYCKGSLKCVNKNWQRNCYIPNNPLFQETRVSCDSSNVPKTCKCQNNVCVVNQTLEEFNIAHENMCKYCKAELSSWCSNCTSGDYLPPEINICLTEHCNWNLPKSATCSMACPNR